MVEIKVVRRKLNVKNLKFIPISEVPEVIRKTQWDQILESIPRGQALTLTEDEASPETVRSAVRRFQKKGKFTQLEVTTRKIDGKKVIYILNPVPEPEPETEIKGHGLVPTPQLPSDEKVFQYITSKPAFAHTLSEIQEHFFSGRLSRSDPEMRALYLRLRELVLKVQDKIERQYGGKFESTKIGREKHFTFKEGKKEGIEASA